MKFAGIILLSIALHLCSCEEPRELSSSLEKWIRSRRGASSDCCTQEALDDLAEGIKTDLDILTQSVFEIGFELQQFIFFGRSEKYPAPSCTELYYTKPGTTSGWYFISSGGKDSTPHKMFCNMDMSGSPFGSNQGWMKVANLDMRRPQEHCPDGFKFVYQQGQRVCARTVEKGCQAFTIPLWDIPYKRLCGRARAFQIGTNNAFHRLQCDHCTINGPYVDGISLTYGSPRKHIWSLAASWTGYRDRDYRAVCPCARGRGTAPPKFVGDNYFCEVGQYWDSKEQFDDEDPLWDGEGCDKDEEKCCEAPGLPWFCTDIEGSTYKDIEVRVCSDENGEDIYLQFLEIYVQ